jgi:hypothetical protein
MYDTKHSLAVEAHTHAAYEHSAANYQQNKGEHEMAGEFARRACKHALEAAVRSHQALRQPQNMPESPSGPADHFAVLASLFCTHCDKASLCDTLEVDAAPVLGSAARPAPCRATVMRI